MTQNKRATEAAPAQGKGSEYQPNTQANTVKEPQHISEAMQEAANVERCSRSGEVSIMAIIAKRMKGGKK